MDIKFRKLKERDWTEFKKLSDEYDGYNLKLTRKFDKSHAFFEKSFSKKDYFKILRRKNKLYISVFDGDKMIGFAYAQTVPSERNESKSIGWLSDIFITKSYRGKGVADKIWDEIMQWFKLKKVSFLKLDVLCNNEHAIKVYKKWGFKPYTMVMSRKF